MIVKRGDLVIAGICIPSDKVIRASLSDELFSGEPVDFLNIAFDFRP